MKSATIIVTILFSTLLFSSCVVFNSGYSARSNKKNNKADNQSMDVALARFPLIRSNNRQSSSLHITVVNEKRKTVADVALTGDSSQFVSGAAYDNLIIFHADVRDFDKTTTLSADLALPVSLVEGLKFEKATDDFYKVTGRQSEQNESCFLEITITKADRDGMVYIYSGKLINEFGTEVSFWGQGDPPPLKIVTAAIIIGSNISENNRYVMDICDTNKAVLLAKKNTKCPEPKFWIKYYPMPFAKLFNRSVWDNFYRDCKAEVICKEK